MSTALLFNLFLLPPFVAVQICQKRRRIGCVISAVTYNAGPRNLSFDFFDISVRCSAKLRQQQFSNERAEARVGEDEVWAKQCSPGK